MKRQNQCADKVGCDQEGQVTSEGSFYEARSCQALFCLGRNRPRGCWGRALTVTERAPTLPTQGPLPYSHIIIHGGRSGPIFVYYELLRRSGCSLFSSAAMLPRTTFYPCR